MSIKTIFVAGPTASGKTALGIELAKRLNGEIISADSMQIYKGIHIASAAPDESERQGVPHYLLEFLEPEQSFSVAEYVLAARECIKKINSKGKVPIVVGGTGLYISSLADNIKYADEPTDSKLRAELEERFDSDGAKKMLSELARLDPQTAAKLHFNDRKRIIRAFEIYLLTGKTVSEQNALSKTGEKLVAPCIIEIEFRNRQLLYDRINRRVELMLEKGLLNEAAEALERNGGGALCAIGHKELASYISGESTLEEAVERLKMQTRRYAKRQLTWFRSKSDITRVYADEDDYLTVALETAKNFLSREELN